MKLKTPKAEYLSPELQLFGRIETPRHTQLGAALEARVLAVQVSEGEAVEAGALLIALDDEEQALIRAPFAGRIARVTAAPGDRVRPGQALLALYDDRALQLRVPVPGSLAGTLKQALAAGDGIEAFIGEQEMPARLLQLASEVGVGSTGLEAIFTLPESAAAKGDLGGAGSQPANRV